MASVQADSDLSIGTWRTTVSRPASVRRAHLEYRTDAGSVAVGLYGLDYREVLELLAAVAAAEAELRP
jgi:hypothetical protein